LDLFISQKNKYNVLKYIVFVYQLMNKNIVFERYFKSLPSPNIICKTFLDWISGLLGIIQKESGKIWQFEYENSLN
jgi:hypothetical protein